MSTSIITIQRDIILNTIRHTGGDEWKVLVVDEISRSLINNATSEEDILNLNVTNVEQIEHRRPTNADMDGLYILSPLPHIVDCLVADLERKRYRKSWLVWTSFLDPQQRAKLNHCEAGKSQIAGTQVMNVNFYPRESRLVTFRDPWSFPILFHPACNNLIREHLKGIAQRVVSLCASLGEYPMIRYYRPKIPTHEASVLCSHLARFIQDELDEFAQFQRDFPPPSSRPRGILVVVDRSVDLISPLLHEFTYQSMAHDLLPIKDGDKVTYKTIINKGTAKEEIKEMDITDKDEVWTEYRHAHMKDVLEGLGEDFAKFRAANPQFAEENNKANVNTIKEMLGGLTEFQKGRDTYTLHLSMAQECMQYFQERKLLEVSSVEQCLATGLDEDNKKSKNLASQIVQLLDSESIIAPDRLRLLLLYTIHRGGLLQSDIRKLIAHAQLPSQDCEIVYNLDLLGMRAVKPLKDDRPPTQPLFSRKPSMPSSSDEINLSRYDLNVKTMLEELIRGTLDPVTFPFTRPHTDSEMAGSEGLSQASLRSARPTWARTRSSADHPRQRIIVFMAGGATYGETRACYEVSQAFGKDVFLTTSHMLNPGLFLQHLADLSADKRRLDIPADRPKPIAPAHLFENDTPPAQPVSSKPPEPGPRLNTSVPTSAMGMLSLGLNGRKEKEKDEKKEKKEKKRHHFFR